MSQATSCNSTYLTFEDYLAYDDGTDTRYGLTDGVLVRMLPKSEENNDIATRLLIELAKYLSVSLLTYKDTEVEVSGRQATCRIPDLLVHREESKKTFLIRSKIPKCDRIFCNSKLNVENAITVT